MALLHVNTVIEGGGPDPATQAASIDLHTGWNMDPALREYLFSGATQPLDSFDRVAVLGSAIAKAAVIDYTQAHESAAGIEAVRHFSREVGAVDPDTLWGVREIREVEARVRQDLGATDTVHHAFQSAVALTNFGTTIREYVASPGVTQLSSPTTPDTVTGISTPGGGEIRHYYQANDEGGHVSLRTVVPADTLRIPPKWDTLHVTRWGGLLTSQVVLRSLMEIDDTEVWPTHVQVSSFHVSQVTERVGAEESPVIIPDLAYSMPTNLAYASSWLHST